MMDQAGIDTWESIALDDLGLYRDAVLAVRAIAQRGRAFRSTAMPLSRRRLLEGMQEVRGATLKQANADKALAALLSMGYLVRLNPNAPRREVSRYLLTVPARSLVTSLD
ncbi:hypothetical protein [Marmoricola sp. RAF53]|uniref:hypothetical protein n=1 Tax=Marmoricola sp. RAF53 TaxID=3233059 RepID=UPI003F967DF8